MPGVKKQNHNQPDPIHLPSQTTPFIGREKEVADVVRLLSDSDCVLLTLVGPGGIGKTRLSIQAGGSLVENFEQGIYFVPLQSVTSQDFLISAIADTLKFSLSGHDPPDVQLCNYLANKGLLLVLDNFEQLLGVGGASLISTILAAAPSVKLLVSSREVLNLQEEWLYPVPGLPVPTDDNQNHLESYDAVRLFVNGLDESGGASPWPKSKPRSGVSVGWSRACRWPSN